MLWDIRLYRFLLLTFKFFYKMLRYYITLTSFINLIILSYRKYSLWIPNSSQFFLKTNYCRLLKWKIFQTQYCVLYPPGYLETPQHIAAATEKLIEQTFFVFSPSRLPLLPTTVFPSFSLYLPLACSPSFSPTHIDDVVPQNNER